MMRLHNYKFWLDYPTEAPKFHKEFNILFLVDGNEKAVDAMISVKNYARIYLKEIEFQYDIAVFEFEYLDSFNADSFQEKIIKSKGFVIIPSKNSDTQSTL